MVIKTQKKSVPKKGPVKVTQAPKKTVVNRTSSAGASSVDIQKVLESHTQHLKKIDDTLSLLGKELKDLKNTIVAVKTAMPVSKAPDTGKKILDSSWHALIEPNREYTQKEIIGITKISQPTLSMAKVRGHIITKDQPGKRGWVVLGSELLKWDSNRARNAPKKSVPAKKTPVVKKPAAKKPAPKTAVAKPAVKSLTVVESSKAKKPAAPAKKTVKAPATSTKTSTKTSTATKKVVKTAPSKTTTPAKKPVTKRSDADIQTSIPNDIPGRISALTMKKVVTQTQFGHEVGLPQKVIYEITTKKRKELSPATIQKITTVLKKYESK